MADNSEEMSLEDVLAAIRRMVIDKEPPVLDLTDVVDADGRVVKSVPQKPSDTKSDFGSFLRLIQEGVDATGNNSAGATEKAEKNLEMQPEEKRAEEKRAEEKRTDERVTVSLNVAAEIPPVPESAQETSQPAENRTPPPAENRTHPPAEPQVLDAQTSPKSPDGNETLTALIRELLTPMVEKWLDQHLSDLVSRTVEAEVKKTMARQTNLL
ncbi:MAG: DUF2497 domain-containing protein [Holosporaceae bacterium]|jgi:cell pole-organizing protein PopZ|nr:DUF2497 domain-containing protein [Holosporaceae bacterium]